MNKKAKLRIIFTIIAILALILSLIIAGFASFVAPRFSEVIYGKSYEICSINITDIENKTDYILEIRTVTRNHSTLHHYGPVIYSSSHTKFKRLSNQLGSKALYQVMDMTELTGLSLDGFTKIDNISCLNKLTNLKALDLAKTNVSSISVLVCMQQLEEVSFRSTPVTDLSPLLDIDSLKLISITKTRINNSDPVLQILYDKGVLIWKDKGYLNLSTQN